jgi:hypothetical protein
LVDKKSQHRLRIVLDASKAHRCKWCGSSQSDWWITEKSGVYCSQDCVRASHSEALGCYLLITFFYTILMIWAWPAVSQDLGWFYLLTFILLAIIPLSLYRNRRYALKIPKGSRNHIGVSEVSLLRKVSAPIECPNCDAKINLRNVG